MTKCMKMYSVKTKRLHFLLKTSLDRARFCCMRTFSNEK